jgi:hypothetical protein
VDPFTAALDKPAKRESATGTPKNSRLRGLAFIQSFRKIVFQEVSITRIAPEMRAYLAEFTLTFHFPPPTSMFVPVDVDELGFSARIGGATSIDARKTGDDWAVGIALGCNMSSGGKFMKRLILLPLLIATFWPISFFRSTRLAPYTIGRILRRLFSSYPTDCKRPGAEIPHNYRHGPNQDVLKSKELMS